MQTPETRFLIVIAICKPKRHSWSADWSDNRLLSWSTYATAF